MTKTTLPFGLWPSPLSPKAVASQSTRFESVALFDGVALWTELRPAEGGRTVIVRKQPGEPPEDILPPDFSARSRVHEYGGGEFLAVPGAIYFTNQADQDIWRLSNDTAPERVTDAPTMRFADFAFDPARNCLIAIAERHAPDIPGEHPENFLATIDLNATPENAVHPLIRGRDFYASPRLSPDGSRLAFLSWDLPHMPWEAAALYIAEIGAQGEAGTPTRIAGGGGAEGAAFQPEWREDGALVFACDKSGWGNLYVWDGSRTVPLLPIEAECAKPLWSLSARAFALLPGGRIIACAVDGGVAGVGILGDNGKITQLETGTCHVDTLASEGGSVILSAGRDFASPAIIGLSHDGTYETLREAAAITLDRESISPARLLTFRADDGGPVYGLYYAPANSRHRGPDGECPPAIIGIHGGPHSQASRGLKLTIQYWTTRGFAYLGLDYGGSTCYGRDYRARLNGQWGLRDVADAEAAARHLAAEDLARADRIAITGGSSGGYTVLMALATTSVFAAGASYYGISDLAALQRSTHKFEVGYVFGLIGAKPGPGGLTDASDPVFAERSPLARAGDIKSPVILFQGLDDKVVPPEQSRLIAAELERRDVPVKLFEFEGEGHGFRRAENVAKALAEEYAFYVRAFGLDGV